MDFTLKRIAYRDTYTIGKLYVGDEHSGLTYFCDTLENCCRPVKIKGSTAIPAGNYVMKLSMSNRFQRVLPEILDVPNFTGIRIHRGNTCDDTEGCILLGENKVKGQVINSTFYENKLVRLLQESKGVRHNFYIV